MRPYFFSKPVQLPEPRVCQDSVKRQGAEQLCRRVMELLHAAALIDGTEPGLLTQEDRESARRRGAASAKRAMTNGFLMGKPHIAYYRTIAEDGFRCSDAVHNLADRVWILDDRCGLADCYLRAAADAALQKGAEVVLCPSPLRRDRIEAVFLPGVRAAYISERAAENLCCDSARRVHLDRIPDAERRRSLRTAIREDRRIMNLLVSRAALYLANAQILCNLDPITCADGTERI